LDICPPSIQDRAFLATADRIELRPVPYADPGAPPTWDSDRRPLIYLTLGTGPLLATAIAALAALDVRVLVAAGRVPVEAVGPVPDNVRVRSWVPQAQLLPRVAAVVHHGGSGTTLGALSVGVPQLILPQGADQFANAQALRAAGAAVILGRDE